MITKEAHAVLSRIGSYRRWRLHNVPAEYKDTVEELIINDWIWLSPNGHLYLTLMGHEALYEENGRNIQRLGGHDND